MGGEAADGAGGDLRVARVPGVTGCHCHHHPTSTSTSTSTTTTTTSTSTSSSTTSSTSLHQRNWMYLQPIFESDDINRQLPAEGKRFAGVDRLWRKTLTRVGNAPHVLSFCDDADLLEQWTKANAALEPFGSRPKPQTPTPTSHPYTPRHRRTPSSKGCRRIWPTIWRRSGRPSPASTSSPTTIDLDPQSDQGPVGGAAPPAQVLRGGAEDHDERRRARDVRDGLGREGAGALPQSSVPARLGRGVDGRDR